jgi:hypothetical protein
MLEQGSVKGKHSNSTQAAQERQKILPEISTNSANNKLAQQSSQLFIGQKRDIYTNWLRGGSM